MTPSKLPRVESVASTLVIKNNLDELVKLSEWIDALAQKVGVSAEFKFQLELALVEAVTNVIEHAFEDDAEHKITLRLEYRQERFTVELIDDGQPFNPTQYVAVELPRTLDEAAEGGLGIHLIRNYTDEMRYHRKNDQNILTMIISHDHQG